METVLLISFCFFCLVGLIYYILSLLQWWMSRRAQNKHNTQNDDAFKVTGTISFNGDGDAEARLQRIQLMTKAASLKDVVNDALDLYETVVELRSDGARLFVGQDKFAVKFLHMASLDRVDKKSANN